MKQEHIPCMNEAEIRAKVIDVWLNNHGFRPDQILLESTFTIRLGRKVHTVGANSSIINGRADYLVRSIDGRNLFIIEAKAAGEPIDEGSREQAISYARLLNEGGIAPFAIVTNGCQTEIIDSITRASLNGALIPNSHPYVASGFRVCVDDLAYRAEALEHLISLSPENLLAFCRAQVDFRMTQLRSHDVHSGLKYIPSLYVERESEREALRRLVDSNQRCVLVLGPPQVGKTNFVCHFIEEQLAAGTPCLFYPAVGLDGGLLPAIREDFEWSFSDVSSTLQVIRHRLARVLCKCGTKLLLFVEGLNENQPFIKAFSLEGDRLQSENICLILSFTVSSAASILLDSAGNPTYAARATGVQKRDVSILEISPSTVCSKLSAVSLGPFSSEEMDRAYAVYAMAYNVSVPPEHDKTHEPLLLRNAMECFRGQTLPATLDAAEILGATIDEKLSRLSGLSPKRGRAIIEEVARRMCEDHVVTEFWLHQNAAQPDSFFDAALLTRRGSQNGPRILDFYVTSERSFVIAHWVRNWPTALRGTFATIEAELRCTALTDVSAEAFRWFLRQASNRDILAEISETMRQFQDLASRRLIVLCLCDYLAYCKDDEDDDRLSDLLEDLRMSVQSEHSEVVEILVRTIMDSAEELEIRRISAIGLGTFDPETCLQVLGRLSERMTKESREIVTRALEPGFRKAVDGILEMYYGDRWGLCPSYLDNLEGDLEASLEEYNRLIDQSKVAIQMFRFSECSDELERLLRILNPEHVPVLDRHNQRSLFD